MSPNSTPKLDTSDFIFDDVIPVRPALIKRMGGDIEGAAIVARIQYRCRAQRHQDDGFQWWKSTFEEFAEEIGISVDRIKRKMKALEGNGWLISKIDNESKWDRTKSYRPNDNTPQKNVSAGHAQSAEPHYAADQAKQGVSAGQLQSAESHYRTSGSALSNSAESHFLLSTEEVEEELKKKTPARTKRAVSLGVASETFEEWYAAYPVHKSRGAAEKAYAKALVEVAKDRRVKDGEMTAAELLLAAAKNYADDPNRNPQFTKHPATWLNQKCWLDERLPTATAPARPNDLVEVGGVKLTQRNAAMLERIAEARAAEAAAGIVPSREQALPDEYAWLNEIAAPASTQRELEGARW